MLCGSILAGGIAPLLPDQHVVEVAEGILQPFEAPHGRCGRYELARNELEEISQRWAVVRKLAAGHSYREIAAETGVSTATIVRINQWLRHGTGGYQHMLDKLDPSQDSQ